MVVPPKHPKMIILGRKTHGGWGKPTILGNLVVAHLSLPPFIQEATFQQIDRRGQRPNSPEDVMEGWWQGQLPQRVRGRQ